MKTQSGRIAWTRVFCWPLLAALVSLGAGPPEPWRLARTTLPPVAVAPDLPIAPRPANLSELNPLPLSLTPRPKAGSLHGPIPTPLPANPPARLQPATPPATRAVYEHAPAVGPTHVYLINGIDPLGMGGFSQLADRIRESGYPDTRFGGWYQVLQFDREIREAFRQDPTIQIVIVGYSFGVYRAKALANRLTRDGIPVALLVYVGGDYLQNSTTTNPIGVGRVVNVTGKGYLLTGGDLFFNGSELSGAENVHLTGVRHVNLPQQDETYRALMNGLNTPANRSWSTSRKPSGAAMPGRIAMGPETLPIAGQRTFEQELVAGPRR